jgi:hypothetical protein
MKGTLAGLSTLTSYQVKGAEILQQPFKSSWIFPVLETGARELCLSIWSFLIVIYSPFHLEYDYLDFNLRSIATQITSLPLCAMLHTNHNHYHLQVHGFIQLAAWHGFFS